MSNGESGSGKRSGSHSLTLERGLRVLRVLGAHAEGMSVSELAKAMSTHRAGLYRLLAPLQQERLVRRGDDNRYTLGVGLIELAAQVQGGLQDVALPELQQLADKIEATTALTIRDGDEAVVAMVREPRNSDLRIAYRTGLRHPLDQAASGIAILASLEPTSGERKAIADARERGWSASSGELLPGASGVGVPIEDGGVDASISAVWLGDRDNAEMASHVIQTAARIRAALHGSA